MSYLEELEALRRERCGVLDVAARGATDYSHGALKIQVAQHHLDEALPNGQKERTTRALRLLVEGTAELRAWLGGRGVEVDHAPIDMVLHCPKCGKQHIDAPEPHEACENEPKRPGGLWNNPPHRSHLCHGCGHIWRPADVPTNGVAAAKTAGKNDSPIASRSTERAGRDRAGMLLVSEAALRQIARAIEGLKRECGMDPESPQAIRNAQYMSLAYAVRKLGESHEG